MKLASWLQLVDKLQQASKTCCNKLLQDVNRHVTYEHLSCYCFRMIILTLLKRIIALLIQDYIVASTIIGAGLQYVLILAQHLRVEEIPTGPYEYLLILL